MPLIARERKDDNIQSRAMHDAALKAEERWKEDEKHRRKRARPAMPMAGCLLRLAFVAAAGALVWAWKTDRIKEERVRGLYERIEQYVRGLLPADRAQPDPAQCR